MNKIQRIVVSILFGLLFFFIILVLFLPLFISETKWGKHEVSVILNKQHKIHQIIDIKQMDITWPGPQKVNFVIESNENVVINIYIPNSLPSLIYVMITN